MSGFSHSESGSFLEAHLRAKLEELTPGAEVLGVTGSGPITVIHSQWIGTQAITLTCRDVHGRSDQVVLTRDKEPSIALVSKGDGPALSKDPGSCRLAAAASHMNYAALPGPMLTISTSDLQVCRMRSMPSTTNSYRKGPCACCSRTTLEQARSSRLGHAEGSDSSRKLAVGLT